MTGITVLISVCALAFGVFYISPGGRSASAFQIPAQPGSLAWDTRTSISILLLGAPSTALQPVTSDTMMVLSISPATRTLSLLSLPANLWVSIPGYGQDRIATAYADGGVRLAQLTVQSVLHVPVPYYLVASGTTIRQLVDAVGGVKLRVLARTPDKHSVSRSGVRLSQFDGTGALSYATGYARSAPGTTTIERQQELFRALITQGLSADTLFRVPSILNDLSGSIVTNFPYDRVSILAHVISQLPTSHITMKTLTVAGGEASPYATNGMHVLLPNWQRISLVSRTLFPSPLASGRAVDVMNGTGVLGRAASLASWLQQAGVRIRHVATAPTGNYPTTQVVIARGAKPQVVTTAGTVATLLQAPIIVSTSIHRSTLVTVLIGQNYQDLSQS